MRHDVPALTDLAAARRRLLLNGAGIAVAVAAFGVVFGLAARQVGMSFVDTVASSLFVFAGASQFAAVGMIGQGLSWAAIVPLTALLNARHLLYSASLAPWFRRIPWPRRIAAAHVLTDEAFALSLPHFSRIGHVDEPGYWLAAACTFVPWQLSTIVGYVAGSAIPEPHRLGLDVVAPAAFAGLTIGLLKGRREVVAAVGGALIAVVTGLAAGTAVGIVAGGLGGSAIAVLLPGPAPHPIAHGDAVAVPVEAAADPEGLE